MFNSNDIRVFVTFLTLTMTIVICLKLDVMSILKLTEGQLHMKKWSSQDPLEYYIFPLSYRS